MLLDYDGENNYTVTQHVPFGYYQAYPEIAKKQHNFKANKTQGRLKVQHTCSTEIQSNI